MEHRPRVRSSLARNCRLLNCTKWGRQRAAFCSSSHRFLQQLNSSREGFLLAIQGQHEAEWNIIERNQKKEHTHTCSSCTSLASCSRANRRRVSRSRRALGGATPRWRSRRRAASMQLWLKNKIFFFSSFFVVGAMRLLRPKHLEQLQRLEHTAEASVTLLPEEPEDMWHAYNLIAVGDQLRASAIRSVSCSNHAESRQLCLVGVLASTARTPALALATFARSYDRVLDPCSIFKLGDNGVGRVMQRTRTGEESLLADCT